MNTNVVIQKPTVSIGWPELAEAFTFWQNVATGVKFLRDAGWPEEVIRQQLVKFLPPTNKVQTNIRLLRSDEVGELITKTARKRPLGFAGRDWLSATSAAVQLSLEILSMSAGDIQDFSELNIVVKKWTWLCTAARQEYLRAAAPAQAVRAGKRIAAAEANIKAREILKDNPDISQRDCAKKAGCSYGLIGKTSVWKALMEARRESHPSKRKTQSVKTSGLTDELLPMLSEVGLSPDEFAVMNEEQKAGVLEALPEQVREKRNDGRHRPRICQKF